MSVADQRNVQIPKQQESILAAISTTDAETFARARDALASVPEGSNADDFRAALADVAISADASGVDVVNAIMGINVLRSSFNWNVDETADGVVVAADEIEDANFELQTLRVRLQSLLGISALWHTSKAYDVGTAYNNSMYAVRVLTDIRPVFDEPVSDAPKSAVLIHNLELRTYNSNGSQQTIYVALDRADLQALKDAAQRALDKADTLTEVLRGSQMAVHNLENQ